MKEISPRGCCGSLEVDVELYQEMLAWLGRIDLEEDNAEPAFTAEDQMFLRECGIAQCR